MVTIQEEIPLREALAPKLSEDLSEQPTFEVKNKIKQKQQVIKQGCQEWAQ